MTPLGFAMVEEILLPLPEVVLLLEEGEDCALEAQEEAFLLAGSSCGTSRRCEHRCDLAHVQEEPPLRHW